MVFRNAILPAAALGSAMLAMITPAARACSCAFRPLCDNIDFAGVVLHGNVLERTEPKDQFGDVTYDIRIIELFKTEGGVDYPQSITITTAANSALCGIFLEVGDEYLLDLFRNTDGDLRSVGSCGATQSWTTLDAEKIATLADIDTACAEDDPCPDCGEFEECLFYTGDIAEDQYYCSAVCDPSPCAEGEECSLTLVGCSAGSICGNGYTCSPGEEVAQVETVEADPCEGRCPDFYECLFYTGDIAADQYYCSAVCDPSPCDDGEECRLTSVGCSAGSICGNGYVCSPAESDDVEVVVENCSACGEFQDCLVWFNGAEEEYYCADFCDPSPCTGGDTCSLVDQDSCDTNSSPCPPVATCTASLVAADEEAETEEAAQEEDPSSAPRLAVGSLTTAAVLMATLLLEL